MSYVEQLMSEVHELMRGSEVLFDYKEKKERMAPVLDRALENTILWKEEDSLVGYLKGRNLDSYLLWWLYASPLVDEFKVAAQMGSRTDYLVVLKNGVSFKVASW